MNKFCLNAEIFNCIIDTSNDMMSFNSVDIGLTIFATNWIIYERI